MVSIDQALCIGCGVCIDLCPEVFVATAEGKAESVKNECELHNLEEVADACPVEAINV
ncbi:ferredoxin [Candidatus Saganbacteria bacterium]|uniref:Ferredoxin n=1 Tax=Candidatus Saganbacteria bacterium TaxID=2575572 RepID=A0A9D6UKW3_UNCSA|nr:ferredoxin [Candidatus Saganbacteria bacterium]